MSKIISVSSEITRLNKVLIHRPDEGISRVSPEVAEKLLFDDIVYLPTMQSEHALFESALSLFVDEVIEVQDYCYDALEASQEKKEVFIQRLIDWEELPKTYHTRLLAMDNKKLAKVLITGYDKDAGIYLFDPIPNFIFTRDIAVVIKDHVLITKAAKAARQRENLLTRFIFHAHPDFEILRREKRIINFNDVDAYPPSKHGDPVQIEGGDIMMFNEDFLFVGSSERTNDYAIETLASIVFEKGLVKHVVKINIPNHRYCMHIDTLFTHIDTHDIICYKPIIIDGNDSNIEVLSADGGHAQFGSVKQFIHSMIDPNMRFIPAGNGISPFQEREQWTDACNMVAVRPGVAFSYDRNPKTLELLSTMGYTIIEAATLIEKAQDPNWSVEQLGKAIITLPSFELSRGRGGSHCMTCPLNRN